MNKLVTLVLIAMGLISSCVPVHYNSIVWDRQKVTPKTRSGISVTSALDDQQSNFFNSANRGPWEIIISVRASEKHKFHLNSITVYGVGVANEVEQFKINREVAIVYHPNSKDWRGTYVTDNVILPARSAKKLKIKVNYRIDGSAYETNSIFTRRNLKGVSSINLLTM